MGRATTRTCEDLMGKLLSIADTLHFVIDSGLPAEIAKRHALDIVNSTCSERGAREETPRDGTGDAPVQDLIHYGVSQWIIGHLNNMGVIYIRDIGSVWPQLSRRFRENISVGLRKMQRSS